MTLDVQEQRLVENIPLVGSDVARHAEILVGPSLFPAEDPRPFPDARVRALHEGQAVATTRFAGDALQQPEDIDAQLRIGIVEQRLLRRGERGATAPRDQLVEGVFADDRVRMVAAVLRKLLVRAALKADRHTLHALAESDDGITGKRSRTDAGFFSERQDRCHDIPLSQMRAAGASR